MLTGIIVPAATPMTPSGDVDLRSIPRLADHLVGAGVDGIFVFGTSGEGPGLTRVQRIEAVDAFVAAVDGRVPLLAGIAGNSVAQSLEAMGDVVAAGVEGLVIMTPLFLDGMGDTLVEAHLARLAEASPLPALLYNIPQHTHNPITPAMLDRLGRIEQVRGLKESSADPAVFAGLLTAAHANGLTIFQGAEKQIVAALEAGADGAVPGIGNVVPRTACDLYAAFRRGDRAEADRLQAEIDEACGIFDEGYWLLAMKHALFVRGVLDHDAAFGLPGLDADQQAAVRRIVESLAEVRS